MRKLVTILFVTVLVLTGCSKTKPQTPTVPGSSTSTSTSTTNTTTDPGTNTTTDPTTTSEGENQGQLPAPTGVLTIPDTTVVPLDFVLGAMELMAEGDATRFGGDPHPSSGDGYVGIVISPGPSQHVTQRLVDSFEGDGWEVLYAQNTENGWLISADYNNYTATGVVSVQPDAWLQVTVTVQPL
ncbi:MAG: hypothetical protein WC184_13075 [Acidimicrobiia bacterium]